ncbi:hypothetical protein [Mycobacteroides abscessus]|uniref:hypothetical protein n=1 Tax=Mycobacteroides abscessus TaxID=36809 RepID=UPI000928323F|nr:hypothetical protein [Mycobacteroides abscessus]MBL3752286.1 YbaB/EbfC family DNA-binding protein [Mycobacteroides abscessus subsp. massiliense]QCO29034.1 hypothetical protein CFE69_24135 [Mycobacteroides abscessus subsp. massiliense]QSN49727.1 YbaB/EbfC family DNA-binding protein [Mycobacteroides abscessus subsp. abscessus]SHY29138.1 ESX-1 secretion-associated protein EspH [Mycobacteroides abscessus subsp. abscessus]SID71131.1 ESX-1 secretion-associated protein EspH [Mycobacteroides absces
MSDTAPDIEEFYTREFSVYNPPGSVGVSCNGRGLVSAVMLDQDALALGPVELGQELVMLGRLARAKYRVALRLFTLAAAKAEGRSVERADRMCRRVQKLPTPEEYADMESARFADRYPA